jgi:hypothetical protein
MLGEEIRQKSKYLRRGENARRRKYSEEIWQNQNNLKFFSHEVQI